MGAAIRSGGATYVGTSDQVRSSFDLTHKGLNIFQRTFNSDLVDTNTGIITCIGHFFVTGEELYCSANNTIGINTTVISGISTDKLPNTVYAIKVSETELQFAATAEQALKYNPEQLIISSVPSDTTYIINGKKQNTRAIISIDNIIQSPVAITSITTPLVGSINASTSEIILSDVTNFDPGDIIRIDSEIMRINSLRVGVTSVTTVSRGFIGSDKSTHTNGATIRKLSGNYNIVDNKLHFAAAPCGVSTDNSGYESRSTFSGRVFLRSGIEDEANETYNKNYVFDDISDQFIRLDDEYVLKANQSNITGVEDNNALVLIKESAQTPRRQGIINVEGDYYLQENGGETKIIFTGEESENPYDIAASTIPLGGRIVSYASTGGIGYQPLISAGATCTVIAGSISTISIGSSGSGYRSNIQPTVNVGIITTTGEITIVGIASVINGHVVPPITITNAGAGLTVPPQVVIDGPIGYYDIPLQYSSISSVGIGTSATVDLYIDNSGVIKSFEMNKLGHGYRRGEILTVGIPTDSALSFSELRIQITGTYSDSFSSWTFGELELLDSFDIYFDGRRKNFQLRKDGSPKSIRTKRGSNIDAQATLLIFINNVLQVPGESYTFTGGSVVTFQEAPKGIDPEIPGSGDKSRILFYRGTKDVDVIDIDILEEIEPGDYVQVSDNTIALTEDRRIVTEIESTDSLYTNPYLGPGLSLDLTYKRPVEVCKSTIDKFIDSRPATKDRIWYEPLINPATNIIQSVGIGTTANIFVESVKTFFDNKKESISGRNLLTVQIIDQEQPKQETFVASEYSGDFGKIIGITTGIVSPGYNTLTFDLIIPEESYLKQISITNPIIEETQLEPDDYFVVSNSNVGYGITSLRNDDSVVSTGSTFIDNVYQVISISRITNGITTSTTVSTTENYISPTIVDTGGTLIIDDTGTVTISGENVTSVTVRVDEFNDIDVDLASFANSDYFGDYSWGKISTIKRRNSFTYDFYPFGLSGIQTSAAVRRYYPLKYFNYIP